MAFTDFLSRDKKKKFLGVMDEYRDIAEQSQVPGSNLSGVFNRSKSSLDKEVSNMLSDAVIGAAVGLTMETAFQTNAEQGLFRLYSRYSTVKDELDAFHEKFDIDKSILTVAYNLLIYGNLPTRLYYSDSLEFERFSFVPDYTEVVPVIIGSQVIGYRTKDGGYYDPFEFVYAQLLHYQDLGGTKSPYYLSKISRYNDSKEEYNNEFVYAQSYLSGAYQPYKSIRIIEDALTLQRIDQSSFMRFILVNVGDNVLSKNAIRLFSFYRSLLKKSRRVDFGSDGFMSSSGFGNEFEMVLPKSGKQDVEIRDIGGQLEIRAIKDLDFQYKRLFASLKVSPSMLGFSEDTGNTFSSEGPAIWEKRFARTVKSLVFSVSRWLRQVDYYYLRSRGFEVSKSDWTYQFVTVSSLEEFDRRKSLDAGLDLFKKSVEVIDTSGIKYNKKYLFTSLLSEIFSSSNVDIQELFNVEDEEADSTGESEVGGSEFTDESIVTSLDPFASVGGHSSKNLTRLAGSVLFMDRDENYRMCSGLGLIEYSGGDNVSRGSITASLEESVKTSGKVILYSEYKNSPDIALANDFRVDMSGVVSHMSVDSIVSKQFKKYRGVRLPVSQGVSLYSNEVVFQAEDLLGGTIEPLSEVWLLRGGNIFMSGKSLASYLFMIESGYMVIPVKILYEESGV